MILKGYGSILRQRLSSVSSDSGMSTSSSCPLPIYSSSPSSNSNPMMPYEDIKMANPAEPIPMGWKIIEMGWKYRTKRNMGWVQCNLYK